MKIETQQLEEHKVKIIVQTDTDTFEQVKKRAARKISQKTKIPGFRPGKAPYATVLRHIGEAIILEEALDLHVKDIYPTVIKQAEIEPYGPGELENITSYEPPTFEFIIPLKPTVKLGDYQSLRIPYEQPTITEDQINKVIDDLQEQQAIIEPVERPISAGDIVNITIIGTRINQNSSDNDDHIQIIPEKSVPVLIHDSDNNTDESWPFSGFSQHLIGLSRLEKKIINHKFDDDFHIANLRGIEAEYDVTIEEIKSRILPEVSDEFAQSIGDYSDIASLKDAIRSELERNETESYNNGYNDSLIQKIIELSEIKYPPEMLEKEIENVRDSFVDRLSRQNMDIDLYLKYRGITQEELNKELHPVAENQLKTSLVLIELSRKEEIKLDDKVFQEETSKTLSEITPLLKEKKISTASEKELMSNIIGNIATNLMMKSTIERLRSIARGEIESVNSKEKSVNVDAELASEVIDTEPDD